MGKGELRFGMGKGELRFGLLFEGKNDICALSMGALTALSVSM